MELAKKSLGNMARIFLYQKTHFSVAIFEMGFVQYVLRSSAGMLFILVALLPVNEVNIILPSFYIPIGIFGTILKQLLPFRKIHFQNENIISRKLLGQEYGSQFRKVCSKKETVSRRI